MNPHPELNALTGLFPEAEPLIELAEHVPPAVMPGPYRRMLAHNHHMTVTMEAHYGTKVDVRVIEQRREEDLYCRKIVLLKQGTEQVVQFGIVRFDLRYVTKPVRDELLRGETPLGRVLIKHNVLRHIDLGAVLRITMGPALAKYLQSEPGATTYGRLATIFCDEAPAVDLLEIPAPLE